MQANIKDLASGAIFAAVGILYGAIAWTSLPIGVAFNMGPGYFPIVLSGMLIAFGIFIAARALYVAQETPFGVVPWRGIVLLTASVLVFAASLEYLGLFLGVFATAFIASLAPRDAKVLKAAATSLLIAVFCTAVFSYGLSIQVPVFGHAFGR